MSTVQKGGTGVSRGLMLYFLIGLSIEATVVHFATTKPLIPPLFAAFLVIAIGIIFLVLMVRHAFVVEPEIRRICLVRRARRCVNRQKN